MKKKLGLGALLVCSLVILVGWNLYNSSKDLVVDFVAPTTGAVSEQIFSSGKLEAAESFTLYSNNSAAISELSVRNWDTIHKGQTLLTFDMEATELQLQLERNNLLIIEKEKEEMLKQHFEDFKSKFNVEGEITTAKVVKPDTSSIDLRMNNQKLLIESLQEKLQRDSLVATEDGVITELDVESGQVINQGTKVAVITDPNNLEIKAALNELDAAKIKIGMDASITGDAFTQTYQGKVSQISPVASSSNTGTNDSVIQIVIKVDAGAEEAASELKPGYSTNIVFNLSGQPHLLLPLSAVKREGDKAYVFKLEDDQAVQVEIQTGKDDGESVEVLEGVTASDQIITNVTKELTTGAKVKKS